MSTMRINLENDWWRRMYGTYLETDPSNKYRSYSAPSGLNYGLPIDSAYNLEVRLKREADGVGAYNVGFIPPRTGNLRALQNCVNRTGNPYGCAGLPQ